MVLLILTYTSSLLNLWIKLKCVTIQMKAFDLIVDSHCGIAFQCLTKCNLKTYSKPLSKMDMHSTPLHRHPVFPTFPKPSYKALPHLPLPLAAENSFSETNRTQHNTDLRCYFTSWHNLRGHNGKHTITQLSTQGTGELSISWIVRL